MPLKKKENRSKPNREKATAKLFYKIEEVTRLTGVDGKTLEAWEKEFPFLTAGVTGGGAKYFREQDVAIIRRIKELSEQSALTSAGIKRKIEEEFGLIRPAAVPPEKMMKTLLLVRDELDDLLSLLASRPGKR